MGAHGLWYTLAGGHGGTWALVHFSGSWGDMGAHGLRYTLAGAGGTWGHMDFGTL